MLFKIFTSGLLMLSPIRSKIIAKAGIATKQAYGHTTGERTNANDF